MTKAVCSICLEKEAVKKTSKHWKTGEIMEFHCGYCEDHEKEYNQAMMDADFAASDMVSVSQASPQASLEDSLRHQMTSALASNLLSKNTKSGLAKSTLAMSDKTFQRLLRKVENG